MKENDGTELPRHTKFIQPINAIYFDGARFISKKGRLSQLPYDECYYPVGIWGHRRAFEMPNGAVVWWREPAFMGNPTQISFAYKGTTLESIPNLKYRGNGINWPSTEKMVAACNRYLAVTESELIELKKARAEKS